MKILYRQNRHTHTINVNVKKVAEVIQLMNRLGYDILRVGA